MPGYQTYIDTDSLWSLTSAEHALVVAKSQDNRLCFAALLLFFRNHGRFPRTMTEIDHEVIEHIAHRLDVASPPEGAFNLSDRTWERHRAEIRTLFGFREPTNADSEALTAWLRLQRLDPLHDHERIAQLLVTRCQELAIELPSKERIDRIVRSTVAAQEEFFCAQTFNRLSPATRTRLEALLRPANPEREEMSGTAPAILLQLCGDPGRPSLGSVQDELAKLELIRRLELPADLFDHALPQNLERCRQRVEIEAPYELRRHPETTRLTWLAAFAHLRGRTLTDDLVDLLIETIHHIGARAERKVDRELLDDIKRVTGKQNLLFELADATLGKPDGIVREVVFPVVSEETLRDLVKEWKATGPTYRTTLRTVIRNSYKGHYRRMVPQVLQVLNFHSNNERHRPTIQALDLVKRYADTKVHTFPVEEEVPLDGVVRGLWREAVIEKDAQGRQRVNRITYEICVLEALREQLRCKEIWVAGANRYRNPDEDLPADFEVQRASYYQALNLPLDPDRFIADLQAEMRDFGAR
jgi:hypothetical protein